MRLTFDNYGARLASDPRLTSADRDRLLRAHAHDANAGMASEYPRPAGMPGSRRVPEAGGINPQEEEMFDQGRRRIRLRGRDEETGEPYGAEVFLPGGGRGYGSSPASVGDRALGIRALSDLERPRDGCDDISAIAEVQRRNTDFWRNRSV